MRHITPGRLEELDPLLAQLRQLPGLVERKPGVFYRRSKAFLHFHEDPAGLFADVRLDDDFDRYPVSTPADQAAFLDLVRSSLTPPG